MFDAHYIAPAGKFILLAAFLTTGCRSENETREKINDETDAESLFELETGKLGKRADFTSINTWIK